MLLSNGNSCQSYWVPYWFGWVGWGGGGLENDLTIINQCRLGGGRGRGREGQGAGARVRRLQPRVLHGPGARRPHAPPPAAHDGSLVMASYTIYQLTQTLTSKRARLG